MNNRVREYLIKVARTKDRFVYYSQLIKDCKLDYNLGLEGDKKKFSKMLGDISSYEHQNERPLLTSLAIYKDPKRNDQGKGFYRLAENLGFGNAKKLENSLFGFEEAKNCRKYWQNDDNYSKESLSSSLTNVYTKLIEKYDWIFSWKKEYLEFLSLVEIIRENIKLNPSSSITTNELYKGLPETLNNYEDFMRKLLKEKANGISSRGQSVLSENNFEVIIKDDNFKIIIKDCITNPTLDTYNLLKKWWTNNDKISNRPLLVNRTLAALNYENLSSTVHDVKFWNVIEIFKESYGFTFKKKNYGNWYMANEELCVWLDMGLSSIFDKIDVEYYVLRNIFVWLIFEEFGAKRTILPNHLIKKSIDDLGGYNSIPKIKRTFKGVDIDYTSKNKRDKDLGDAGEELVKNFEKQFLEDNGLSHLSGQVNIVKDGMGYDVYSFDINENPKFIEVKTTQGKALTPFYLSDNEVEFMRLNKESYCIYRVYNYDEENNSGEFFEFANDVESQLLMQPTNYKVFKKHP